VTPFTARLAPSPPYRFLVLSPTTFLGEIGGESPTMNILMKETKNTIGTNYNYREDNQSIMDCSKVVLGRYLLIGSNSLNLNLKCGKQTRTLLKMRLFR
jgi:hypothetical protein